MKVSVKTMGEKEMVKAALEYAAHTVMQESAAIEEPHRKTVVANWASTLEMLSNRVELECDQIEQIGGKWDFRLRRNRKQRIDAAAIRVPCQIPGYRIYLGGRHGDIIINALCNGDITKEEAVICEQGFFTSDGHFVTREEALVIAREAGQVGENTIHPTQLFSEDLW